jgi:hypothetical protein
MASKQRSDLFVGGHFTAFDFFQALFDIGKLFGRELIDTALLCFHLDKNAHRILLPFGRPGAYAIKNFVDLGFCHVP